MNATVHADPEGPDLSGCRILLVEDEYFIADDIRRELERCGASVVGPAPSLAQATSLASDEELTCAVLDLNLRGESALEVAEILHRRRVPFVYSTGYQEAVVPEHLKGAPHLEKPFRIEHLLRAVGGICSPRE